VGGKFGATRAQAASPGEWAILLSERHVERSEASLPYNQLMISTEVKMLRCALHDGLLPTFF
jgi:hypothetical protein